jgi:hypothetical protein
MKHDAFRVVATGDGLICDKAPPAFHLLGRRFPGIESPAFVGPALVVKLWSLASETGRWLPEPVFSRVVGLQGGGSASRRPRP